MIKSGIVRRHIVTQFLLYLIPNATLGNAFKFWANSPKSKLEMKEMETNETGVVLQSRIRNKGKTNNLKEIIFLKCFARFHWIVKFWVAFKTDYVWSLNSASLLLSLYPLSSLRHALWADASILYVSTCCNSIRFGAEVQGFSTGAQWPPKRNPFLRFFVMNK